MAEKRSIAISLIEKNKGQNSRTFVKKYYLCTNQRDK